jgi:3-phenylpropionate/trans-cinnamate dioxygenase ferredoxin reductase subunit
VPWFWSDQYDTKLQIAGLPIQVARLVVRGDAAEGRFAVFHLNDRQQVQAVEAVNAAPEFLMGRRLIAARRTVNVERLCNSKISMKEVAV